MIFVDKRAPDLDEREIPWEGPESSEGEFVTDALDGMMSRGYDDFLRGCRKRVESQFGEDTADASVKDNRKRILERMRNCLRMFQSANADGDYVRRLPEERRATLKKFAASDLPALLRYAESLKDAREHGRVSDIDSEDAEMG